eukprot:CAMPEP_0116084892 /NCGR_PEP_ID=MMETSP0327-20121206/4038_1 /TAXON_ID=44447 /ORGANISM="Pseudo-nitzschia delicatissima, Strain B596" /LENGTH=650 /DNA_ID=CAMNT_0003575855 /DNA_START=272 /DNA_END=2224 /DNA_ORIENTATION=-
MTITNNYGMRAALCALLFLAHSTSMHTANAWMGSNTIQSRASMNKYSKLLQATIEDQLSGEEQSRAPRRTRRIDDILEEYEATGDAGLTISVLESTLKREQEKTSTLSVQLAHAQQIIDEQKRNIMAGRSSLQEKSQALLETQRKLQELERRLQMNPQQQQQQKEAPKAQQQQQQSWWQGEASQDASEYPLITNWSINLNTGEVTGSVSRHPSIPDGTTIVTSGLNPESFTKARHEFSYDPDQPPTVVVTRSGSMYQLGVQKQRKQAPPRVTPQQQQQQKRREEMQRQKLREQINPNISLDIPLTGESISNGMGTKYLLAGQPKRKPSGRSEIVLAYKCDDSLRVCDSVTPYVIKLSTNKEKLRREYENYKMMQDGPGSSGLFGGALSLFDQQNDSKGDPFVTCFDFLPVCEASIKYAQHSALVMEKGHEDLRDYEFNLQSQDDPEYAAASTMDPSLVWSALLVAAKCIDVLHSRARLVWTDLKAENLIFMEPQESEADGSIGNVVEIKGIDLESAIPHRGNPLDYTPEACPPEFAKFHLEGKAYDFVLDYSYDVWSFGMLAYELATGKAYFRGKTPTEIMSILGDPNFVPPLGDDEESAAYLIPDPQLRMLIQGCLKVDPRSRISVRNIVRHAYFTQYGNQDYESGTFW